MTKWLGSSLGLYNAYVVNEQHNAYKISTPTMYIEQLSNIFSTLGGKTGAYWGIGWELGRITTHTRPYQDCRNDTWLTFREEVFGY